MVVYYRVSPGQPVFYPNPFSLDEQAQPEIREA